MNTTKRFTIRVAAGIVILTGIVLCASVLYISSNRSKDNLIFSQSSMFDSLWNDYKSHIWDKTSGRTVDRSNNNITTSEGQSYTMLRAVWQGDKTTFDKTWDWTQQNIQHQDDSLFSWKWGKKSDGTYGVLTNQNGQNTATDADQDIALALLMAASKWQQQSYLDASQKIVGDIWKNEVVLVNGTPYVMADDVEKSSQGNLVINPSYLAPYAYRLFANIDPSHNWNGVVDSSYSLLNTAIASPLDKDKSAGLVPDWVVMDRSSGQLTNAYTSSLTSNYGFDAMRSPWRIALDYQWNKDDRSKDLLKKMSFLGQEWDQNQKIDATYAHDGSVQGAYESAAVYGGSIGYFSVINPTAANQIYTQKLEKLYDTSNQGWRQKMSYYDDNWTWFGMALYDNHLVNLGKDLKTKD